ncbi:hypothetical protein EGH21_12400 [Halomicroarcula sp. F13]|uniref:Integral membrane protein n=1 Tax=Haloarcula rubra TaxID=2487747 RepID=A0AAW4PRF3_9EURY|nr:hypothetical protein [Halomicroarcula rubra]MBX0323831.1 hypothetical protein [Halomicroarcula rubra]
MATRRGQRVDRAVLLRTGGLVGVCTLALTAAFVGVVALVTGGASDASSRLQLYVLAGAVTFVAGLVVLEESRHRGQRGLVGASVAGIVGFLQVALGTEGVVYAVENPEVVVSSDLFVYLVAAALVASGLGYWSVRNWRLVGRRVPGDRL